MKVNADFSKRTLVHGAQLEWTPSPLKGVERRMFDRVGAEVARATSLVKYAPHSMFETHTHGGGEEFLVLDGVFKDEHGAYPAGTYMRNPPTTRHTPRVDEGCLIFVKLWQFIPADRTAISVNIADIPPEADKTRPGVYVRPLFKDLREQVQIEDWDKETSIQTTVPQGAEILVLSGSLCEAGDTLQKYTWLRLPGGYQLNATAGPDGARIWIKYAHLDPDSIQDELNRLPLIS